MDLIKFYQFIYRLKYQYIIWFDFGQTSNIRLNIILDEYNIRLNIILY